MTTYKVKDLKVGMKDVDIVVELDFFGEVRTSSGGDKYLPIICFDETGEIKVTLFGPDCKKAKAGKKVKITKGYVTQYEGQLQLNTTMENPVQFV